MSIRSGLSLPRRAARAALALAVLTIPATVFANGVNEPPLAYDGGPYAGSVGIPVSFDGSASFDEDGDPLTFAWDFGDGSMIGVGPKPTHAYAAPGQYIVTLTVSDGQGGSNLDWTWVDVTAIHPGRAWVQGGSIRLSGTKPVYVRVEPTGGSFNLVNILPGRVWLESDGTGSVSRIRSIPTETLVDGDKDRNGVAELRACFARADVQQLFDGLSSGTAVDLRITGQLRDGSWFLASFTTSVDGHGKTLGAILVHEPSANLAELRVAAEEASFTRVRVFDVRGRLVGSALGSADGRFDLAGVVRRGGAFGPGVYFYRAEGREGAANGRFVLLQR